MDAVGLIHIYLLNRTTFRSAYSLSSDLIHKENTLLGPIIAPNVGLGSTVYMSCLIKPDVTGSVGRITTLTL